MKVEIFNLGRWLSIEGDLRVYVKKLNPTDIWEVGIRKEIGERGGGYLEGIVARFKEHARAEQYKEVVNEDAIKISGNIKAPDYSFRIGGTRIFFVEAKISLSKFQIIHF